jgi:hypothetical protein
MSRNIVAIMFSWDAYGIRYSDGTQAILSLTDLIALVGGPGYAQLRAILANKPVGIWHLVR